MIVDGEGRANVRWGDVETLMMICIDDSSR